MDIERIRALRGLLYHSKNHGVYNNTYVSNSRGVIFAMHMWISNGFKRQYKICSWCSRGIDDSTSSRYWHTLCYQFYATALGTTSYPITNKPLIDLPDWDEPCCNLCGISRNQLRFRYNKSMSDVTLRIDKETKNISYQERIEKSRKNSTDRYEASKLNRFELDHKIAISIARIYGYKNHIKSVMPDNLQWLCYECHLLKTKQDRQRLANISNGLPETWQLGLKLKQKNRNQMAFIMENESYADK